MQTDVKRSKLPSDATDIVMEDVPLLTNLLQYHDAKDKLVFCRTTLTRFVPEDAWFYAACPSCSKQMRKKPRSQLLLICRDHEMQQPHYRPRRKALVLLSTTVFPLHSSGTNFDQLGVLPFPYKKGKNRSGLMGLISFIHLKIFFFVPNCIIDFLSILGFGGYLVLKFLSYLKSN
ncbi:uncharacterized protein LOC133727355 [Rosa rugosa]|uniref:uncharacterized protein LOC133727355 n=1 Tax=Rosa rugosa TaxID=74645 RepID=UPI002B4047A2|nr:uncharacterized protein LOC133727355 [Rosa rugosa]